jgi:hypothetical protein
MSKAADVIRLLEKKEYGFKNSNLYFLGIGSDLNGNKTARFSFPNGKSFSIQTLDNLPSFHKLTKGDFNITPAMEKEAIGFIQKHGTDKQKKGLRVYEDYPSPAGKIKYVTIDTRTVAGLKKAEALKAKGWVVGSVGLTTVQMYKK